MGHMSPPHCFEARPDQSGSSEEHAGSSEPATLPPSPPTHLRCHFERGPTIQELVTSVAAMSWVFGLPQDLPVESSWALGLCPPRASDWDEVSYFTDGSLRHGDDASGAWAAVRIGTDHMGCSFQGARAAPFLSSFLTPRGRGGLDSTDVECAA
eukprot:5607799-Pyramimonas_sp.AAC.1